MAPPVSDDTRISLVRLASRRDGEEWCIGRVDSGDFIAAPDVAKRALDLLGDGLSVAQVRQRLLDTTARDIDVAEFVRNLVELGFVSDIDGCPLPVTAPTKPSFARVRPRHVRWLLSPAIGMIVLLMVATGIVAAVLAPRVVPSWHDLLWQSRGSVVLAGNAVIAWSIIFLHELAHLFTARAAGVPGKVRMGTRLQFLVAQTDVTGIWAAPRAARMTVYLAGMVINLVIAAVAVVIRTAVAPGGEADRLLAAVALLSLILLMPQFLVFMRTDLYFVMQDMARCRNLYGDGSAYFRYQVIRIWHAVARRANGSVDPSRSLPTHERRAVRCYAVLLVLGTVACLAVAVVVSLPVAFALLAMAVTQLTSPDGWDDVVDGLLTCAVVAGFWLLWARMWWRRHGSRVRGWLARYPYKSRRCRG